MMIKLWLYYECEFHEFCITLIICNGMFLRKNVMFLFNLKSIYNIWFHVVFQQKQINTYGTIPRSRARQRATRKTVLPWHFFWSISSTCSPQSYQSTFRTILCAFNLWTVCILLTIIWDLCVWLSAKVIWDMIMLYILYEFVYM